jgi:hypothetical protein
MEKIDKVEVPEEVVNLVHEVVGMIEDSKGYKGKINKQEVKIVLEAGYLVVEAEKRVRTNNSKRVSSLRVTTPEIMELLKIANLPTQLSCERCDNG